MGWLRVTPFFLYFPFLFLSFSVKRPATQPKSPEHFRILYQTFTAHSSVHKTLGNEPNIYLYKIIDKFSKLKILCAVRDLMIFERRQFVYILYINFLSFFYDEIKKTAYIKVIQNINKIDGNIVLVIWKFRPTWANSLLWSIITLCFMK